MLTDTEARQLDSWSHGPAASYPADATIPALFAAQVASNPDATALAFGSGSVTYAELDRRSNALAWLLRRRGVGADMPVGVAIGRGTDLIAALLAVLKAGGAYLPIDIGSPASRAGAMIAAADARFVLVTAETAAEMPQLPGVDIVRVDQQLALAADEHAAPPDVSHPLSLAYISFTSGSTGVPKGVAVPQRAVIRLVSDPTFASLGPGERLLHLAPVAFDASTLEIWGALLTGATVVVAPPGPLGLSDIASLLRTADVTVAWLTAGLFHQLAEADINAIVGVPVVLAGGDVLNPGTVRAVLAARRGRPLVNGYGPTENTTFTTCHVMTDPSQVGPTVSIGRPIQHTIVHILDERGLPVPIGVTGELYTGGDGLARGYAGNAAATARTFVPDPSGHGTRLYRTGDLARWRADGTLEFVGRVDDQVKIRGFRIEPGEVAAVLRAHPGVQDSVVLVAGEGAQRHLVGYVTPADGVDPATLEPSLLRDFVARRLPDYLVPTGFKALDRFPLNANGKVDRAALPEPERETRESAAPPRGATEERLADIWRLLLSADGIDGDIGREDSFFALGGNSLSAARLMFRIREAFDVELPMATFYEAPTLAACAAAIDAARPARSARPAADHTAPSAVAPSSIDRRDRSAHRVEAPARTRGAGGLPAAEDLQALRLHRATTKAAGGVLDLVMPMRAGDGPALFCAPPVVGLSWCYMALLPLVDARFPLYGLQARGLRQPEPLPSTMQEMAQDYADQIRKTQPSGPYQLLGWSLGGNIAFAIAEELERRGEQIGLLVILDANLANREGITMTNQPWMVYNLVLAQFGYVPALTPADPEPEARMLELVRRRPGLGLDEWPDQRVRALQQVIKNNVAVAQTHQPGRVHCPLLFFSATRNPPGLAEKLEIWRSFVDGPIEAVELECDHRHILLPEPMARLGPALSDRMARLPWPAQVP